VLRIRELDAPSRVLRQSDFNVQAVIENFAASDGSLRIRILEGDVVIAEDEQAVRKGNNLLTWSRDIASGETGDRDLTLEVSGGNKTKRVEHRVAVVEKKPVHVLYYQGALDWGFRFLNTVLSRDPGFHVTALFNPSIAGRVRTGGGDPGALTDLPSKAGDLQPYQIVILANVFADQLSDAQQRALDEYTRGGGGLLFIQPNDQGTMAFSGTRLESILPVVFEDKPAPKSAETEAERFRRQMAAQNQVTFEDPFAVATARPPDALLPFAFPEESPLAEILRLPGDDGKLIHPQFVEYARVRSVKPGAEILATHPKDRTARGEPRVLLATQKFGKGRASVLSTDSLWRWRLSLPSDSVEVATFWQQLLMWLSAAPSKDLRFQEKWTEASNQTPVTLTVINSPNRPEVRILAPNGSERDGDPQQGAEAAQWVIRWTPDQTGIWQVSARSATGDFAGKSITVVAPGDVPDLANLPPNLETMRALALATGGQMIADGVAPSDWRSGGAAPPPLVLSEHRQPAWNTWWLLCLCLGVYAAELILRRRWQLI
jgi:hypothetical protein